MRASNEAHALFTIGHSNQPLEDFLARLRTHGIRLLADIRRFPGSRKWPWFGKDVLPGALAAAGIGYRHFPALGGRRTPAPDSPNGAWRVPQFQAYADHMSSAEFQEALDALNALLPDGPLAVMCAEVLPWRCHRNLLSDAEVTRGIPVFHILSNGSIRPHTLADFARVDRSVHPPRITYPKAEEAQARLDL